MDETHTEQLGGGKLLFVGFARLISKFWLGLGYEDIIRAASKSGRETGPY